LIKDFNLEIDELEDEDRIEKDFIPDGSSDDQDMKEENLTLA
jgi:hypothetical protein